MDSVAVLECGQDANRPRTATNGRGHDTEAVTSMRDKLTAKDALYEIQRRWIEVNGYDPDKAGDRFRDPWYMCPVRVTECECYGGDHQRSFWFRFVKTDMRGRGGDQGEMYIRAASRREATLAIHARVMSDPAWDPRGKGYTYVR